MTRRRPLLAASGVAALCVAASLALLFGGRIGLTSAGFVAETKNANSAFAGGWVPAATPGTQTVSGADVTLNWTAGTPSSSLLSQQLYYADVGSTSNCNSVGGWTATGSALSATAATTTDTARGSSSNGNYVCYRIDGQYNSWSTPAYWSAIRVGFYATAAVIANSSGRLDNGDTFAVTFNQPPAVPTATGLCTFAGSGSAAVILVGSACANSSSTAVFRFSLSSGSLARGYTAYSVSWGVSGNTLTGTVGSQPSTSNRTTSSSPAWTFTPGNVASATGSLGACTTATLCTPTPSGSF